MKGRFLVLAILSVLPWSYIGADLLFDFAAHMNGFGYLPFFALLFIKEMALKPPRERAESVLKNNPYWKDALVVAAAVLLTIGVVVAGIWIGDVADAYGEQWLWALFTAFALGMICWDIKRAYPASC